MELNVFNLEGKDTGSKVKLNDLVFGVEPNEHAVYLDVKHFLAAQRQGTHKAKERSEVSGSTKKLFKQKGTGGARHGSIKAGTYVGGARIFGPKPRDYSFKINAKTKELARKSVLSSKVKDKLVTVLEDFDFDAPKTKSYINILKALQLDGKKTLMILPEYNKNVVLSGRNLPNSKVISVSGMNTYELLNSEVIILSKSAVENLNNI